MLNMVDLPDDVAALKAIVIAVRAIVYGHKQSQIDALLPWNYAATV